MKLLLSLLPILLYYLPIKGNTFPEKFEFKQDYEERADSLLKRLNTTGDSYIMVAAHRGDWSHAPENSLAAIENAIELGVDIVEIDVRMTKDKVLVLMHDRTIDRTTTGKGKLSNWPLDALKTLHLKNNLGIQTHHKIPTLEEALLLARGSVLINLDKCSMHISKIVKILNKTGTQNHVIFKRKKEFHKIRLHKKCSKHQLKYIPRIKKNRYRTERQVKKFTTKYKPIAFDLSCTSEDTAMLSLIKTIKKKACKIWINTIQSEQYDTNNKLQNYIKPDKTWGWAIDQGANIILTDHPALLIDYLRTRGLRNKSNPYVEVLHD